MAKVNVTRKQLMKMKEQELIDFAAKNGLIAELNEIAETPVKHKKYPRVLKPMRHTKDNREDGTYNPEKMTWQADKTKKPQIIEELPTFLEIKTTLADKVLKLPKVPEKKKELTFRDRIAEAAHNA